jgi:hypothetical protein
MHPTLLRALALLCAGALQAAWAQDTPEEKPAAPTTELIWSAGLRLKMGDIRQPGQLQPRPIIGLRYGRWRTGPVDGDSWHRFGQVKTDNTLTYDWLDTARFRTSLSASIVNLQKDTTLDALEPGRKTLRGKASMDYLGWSHWSVGLVATQDLLNRGAGTALSPSVTYRQALSEDSTVLLSQSATWATATMWTTDHELNPTGAVHQGRGWGSLDTSLTLRQRWKPHVSWYAQLNRSQVLGPLYPAPPQDRTVWSAQAGVVYFGR